MSISDTLPRNSNVRKGSSDFYSKLSDSRPDSMRYRGMTFSGSQLPRSESRLGLEESGKFNSFNDTSGEHERITMKTRIAVRDENPHRFQVVPLRDAGKLHPAAENASRRTMPTPPKNLPLRSPSGKLSPYAQSRLLHSSPSAQSLLVNPLKENHHLEDMELNVNKTLAPSESKMIASPSSFSLHKLKEDVSVLSEWDMNRERPRPIARKSESSRRSSHKSAIVRNLPSKGAPSDPQTHTTSQSLHLKSRLDRNYPRFTSLSDFQVLGIAQASALSDLPVARKNNNEKAGKVDHLSSSLETNVLHSKSKRRHAIYTASLFLPDFAQLDHSEGTSNTPGDQPFPDPSLEEKSGHQGMHTSFQLDPDITIRPEFQGLLHLADHHTLHDPDLFEIGTWGSMELLPFESPLQQSSPKVLSAGLRVIRGLSFSKPSRIRPIVDLKPDNTVYSKIVLDLFTEIDKAIEEWNTPRGFSMV